MFASCFFQNIPAEQQEKILKRIEKKLHSKLCQNGSWIADYKRIRIKAVKPTN
jgi:trans-aconitate 2-methyltransferase